MCDQSEGFVATGIHWSQEFTKLNEGLDIYVDNKNI